MALRMRDTSRWWYAVLQADGRRKVFNLNIEIKGRRPPTLRELGDNQFEASRMLAQEAHDELKEALSDSRVRQRLASKLKTAPGSSAKRMECPQVPTFAEKILKRSKASKKHRDETCSLLKAFTTGWDSRDVSDVTPDDVRRWFRSLDGSARRRNWKLGRVKWVFRELVSEGYLDTSPAEGIKGVPGDTQHREPFTPKEIEAMLEIAGNFACIIVTSLCTGLRLTDCMKLRWESIDLQEGWINVATSKTGETAETPLMPRLREILPKKKAKGYVWKDWCNRRTDVATQRFARIRERAEIKGRKDFHSLRVTWVTEALSAGIPIELVRRVTGHQTVEVVLKHYFKPGRDQFRRSLEKALPEHLTGISNLRRELNDELDKMDDKAIATLLKAIKAGTIPAQ